MKSKSGDLHRYIMYSNCMPDIMILAQVVLQTVFTMLLSHTKQQSRMGELIQSNIYRILPNVNQVIYTLDTTCIPNIMILAQAVLQIFCSQGCFSERILPTAGFKPENP